MNELNWREVEIMAYGEKKKVLVKQKIALWYWVGKDRPLNIILFRDPEGKWSDGYFFTTDVRATAEKILEDIIRRNAIELMHKDSKQIMGVHEGQSRLPLAVKRQIPFGIGLMTLIIVWYLKYGCGSKEDIIPRRPWYVQKNHACFKDMLACLRRTLWRERFFANSTLPTEMQKIIYSLIEALATAS